jgi:hypothetical protein
LIKYFIQKERGELDVAGGEEGTGIEEATLEGVPLRRVSSQPRGVTSRKVRLGHDV